MGFIASRVIVSQNFLLELKHPFSLSWVICSHPQIGRSPSGRERGRTPLTDSLKPTIYSPQLGLLWWVWFSLSEHRLIRTSSISEGLHIFFWFSCSGVWSVGVRKPLWGGFFQPLLRSLQDCWSRDCTTCGLCNTQSYKALLNCSFIFVWTFCVEILYHKMLPVLVALNFVLA